MRLECRGLDFICPASQASMFGWLDFILRGPGFNAVFGPSGVGTTSLARIVAGKMPPSAGKITTKGISKILHTCNLERLSGWATLAQHLDAVSPPDKAALRRELMQQAKFSQLSLGQRNRINFLRYFAARFRSADHGRKPCQCG